MCLLYLGSIDHEHLLRCRTGEGMVHLLELNSAGSSESLGKLNFEKCLKQESFSVTEMKYRGHCSWAVNLNYLRKYL